MQQLSDKSHYQSVIRSVLWTVLMGIVTVFLCLLIAERYLGITGRVTDVKYDAFGTPYEWTVRITEEPGRWFRSVWLILIPLFFMRKVRWHYTWINLFVYISLYFPVKDFAGQWPAMGYLADNSGFLAFPQIVNPFVMAFHFWGAQSLVYLICNILRWIYIFINKKREVL